MPQLGVYDYSRLRGKIRERNCTQEKIATEARINPATLSQKLSGRSMFKQNEITELCKILEILPSEIPEYFFAN